MDPRFVAKRLGLAGLTFFLVINVSFFLIRYLPGGPMEYILAQADTLDADAGAVAAQQRIAEVYININPDRPLYIQWWDYVTSVLQGDLGRSIMFDRGVAQVMLEALPWTAFIIGIALIVYFIVGIFLGAFLAYVEGSTTDYVVSGLAIVTSSIPYYIFAFVLLFSVSYRFGWFPTGGRTSLGVSPELSLEFVRDALWHAALPILSTIIMGWGGVALGMRGNSISVLGTDYLRVARIRGVGSLTLSTRYVAKNAVLPLYVGFMISIGSIFGGSVILETIFNYPGMGYVTFRALEARDFPLLMGGFILITATVLVCIVIADLTYSLIDPRISEADNGN